MSTAWILAAFGAGALLGLVYFLALWRTVQGLPTARQPALWTLGSLVLRLAVLLGGLYFIADGHWQRLAAALVGVVLVRTVLVRRLAPAATGTGGRP